MKCPVCKKNISDNSLRCPYCKTRTGLICSHCNTVNPMGTLLCKKCGQELLKVCSHCHSVNFPMATKCRKCGSPFGVNSVPKFVEESIKVSSKLEFSPTLSTQDQA